MIFLLRTVFLIQLASVHFRRFAPLSSFVAKPPVSSGGAMMCPDDVERKERSYDG